MREKDILKIAKKKWGQNFLRDIDVVVQFIDALELKNTDRLVEIGPGLGALTEYMVLAVEKLTLIEIDPDYATMLGENLSDYTHVKIFNQDVLTMDVQDLVVNKKANKLIGSLPYNISKKIIDMYCGQYNYGFETSVFMLQKEVAHDYIAFRGKNTLLHSLLSVLNDIDLVIEVEKSKFIPVPQVDSAIIKLTRKSVSEIKISAELYVKYQQFLKNCFRNPRKKLKKNLSAIYNEIDWDKYFADVNIKENARVEEVSSQTLQSLFLKLPTSK